MSEKSEIRVQDVIERRVAVTFPANFRHHYALIEGDYGSCYWCKEHIFSSEVHYALVNVWGTVYDIPCCKECFKENNGKARDEL